MSIQTPDWVKHAIFYQIFPDRFAQTTQYPRTAAMQVGLEPWESPPTLQGYKGGDLWGVIEQLDYLQDLGVTALYLNPIFQSACNHRYHTHDYYTVDPLLGGNEAFRDLLIATHQRGMKVILDGVFNHASRGFFFFNDILENGPHSPWLDWFQVTNWPVSAYDGRLPANYESWVDNRALPQFNHDNPAVREYIMQIAEYWLQFGIDGWRLDVPFEIKVSGFWQEFRDRVKAINPEAYIVGEVWEDARQWLDGTQFDGVMNYLFAESAIAFAAGDRVERDYVESPAYFPYPPLNAAEYDQRIQKILALYDWEIQLTQLNLLASQDTARLWTIAGGETSRPRAIADATTSVTLSTLLLLTFPGAPSIYYGDEVGLGGGLDPDCRRTFPPPQHWNQEILQCHQDLIQLRHRYPALRIGRYHPLIAEGMVYGFVRQLSDPVEAAQTLVVLLNAGTAAQACTCPLEAWGLFSAAVCRYGTGKVDLMGNQIALTLAPRSGLVLELIP